MEHTPECIAQQKLREDWQKRWPKHCRKCEGTGTYYWPGNRWDPPDSGPCGCVDDGRCPRCSDTLIYINLPVHKLPFWIRKHLRMDCIIFCPHCFWRAWKPDVCPDVDCVCDLVQKIA